MGLLHASIVNTLPGVRLLTVYDKDSTMVKFTKKAFTDICVTDNLEIFSDFHLDAVYVTTPIPTHFSIVQAIYSMGTVKHLFVEKTLASSYEQAAQLCQEAKTANGVNMVGYMSRFAPTFKKARALLQEEAIGEVVSFQAYTYGSDFVGVKGKAVPVRGGAVRDLGSHVIDLALWFFGDLELESAQLELSAQEGPEDGGYFEVRGSNGLVGEFDISWRKEGYRSPEFGLIINGSKGTIKVANDSVKIAKDNESPLVWYRHNLDDSVAFLLGAPEYFREDEHFIRSILGDGIADPDFNTAAKVDYLIDQVKQRTERFG